MAIGKYVKAPDERKRYELDYSDWLDDGELVSSVTFSISPATTSPLVVDESEVTPDTLGVQFYVAGGLTGSSYDVVAALTTSSGQIKEDVIKFVIKEPT